MSYHALGQTPTMCGPDEHFDWETNQCAPGLCPPGSHVGASGGCEEGPAPESPAPSAPSGHPASYMTTPYPDVPGSEEPARAGVLGSAMGAFLVAGALLAAGIYFYGRHVR